MKKAILILLIGLLCLSSFGLYILSLNQRTLVAVHKELVLPPGYESMDGMKIVLFTDLHIIDTPVELENFRRVIRRINVENPDVVLFGGDLLATGNLERPMYPVRIISRLRKLKAEKGIYAVTGNHDWMAEHSEELAGKLKWVGIEVLDNRCVTIPGRCNIVGVQDEAGPVGVRPEQAMKDIDPSLPTIALVHRPEYSERFPEKVKLYFAGHTHGGQINLPWFRTFFLRRINEELFDGHEHLLPGDKRVHISYGIGTSWIRVRVNCPSEITIFKCRSFNGNKTVK